MATRFYLTGDVAPPVPLPALPSGWAAGTANPDTGIASPGKLGIPIVPIRKGELRNTPGNIPNLLALSPPLTAQTISGDLTAVFKGYESNATGDQSLQVAAYVVNGTTTLATLLAPHAAALNTTAGALGEEFLTSGSVCTRIIPTSAMTSYACAAGDRLMFIVGFRTHTSLASLFTCDIYFGDDQATDYALTSGLTTSINPWIELSGTVTFASTGDVRLFRQAADVLLVPDRSTRLYRQAVDVLYSTVGGPADPQTGWGRIVH